jgi:hypothetical protein
MAQSIPLQILQAVVTSLVGATPAAERVSHSRAIPIGTDEMPCIRVKEGPESKSAAGAGVDDATLTLQVCIDVGGDPWTVAADAIAVPAHKAIVTAPGVSALISSVRHTGSDWDDHDAEQTIGCLTLEYQFRYRVSASDISTSTIL